MTHAQRKQIRLLHRKKHREETARFLVEGEKRVLELIQANTFEWETLWVTESFLEKHPHCQALPNLNLCKPNDLQQAGTLQSNDKALAVVLKKTQTPFLESVSGLFLALEAINDPGNLGTILRIADWYGVSAVLCSPETVELYNPKVIAASMGSFLRVNVLEKVELPDFLTAKPLAIWGMLMEGKNLHQTQPPPDLITIIGNESHGISPELQKLLTQKVTIPRFGEAESLNAGIATAIFCDFWRQKQ